MMHLVLSYNYYHFECDVIIYSTARRKLKVGALAMECSQTSRSSTSSAFENNELVYIHCVSKENFNVTLKGFTCISLICREIHVSFVDAMDERRIALVPVTAENSAVDDLFASHFSETFRSRILNSRSFPCGTAVEGYVNPCSLVASYFPWKSKWPGDKGG